MSRYMLTCQFFYVVHSENIDLILNSIYRVNMSLFFFSYNSSINNSFVSDCALVFVVIFEIFVELLRSKLFQVVTTPFGIFKHTLFNFDMFVFY